MTQSDTYLKVIKDFWGNLIREERIQKHYSVIPKDNIIDDANPDGSPLNKNECYFRITLNNLYLKDRRNLWKESIPMVHSLLTFKNVGKSEVTNIPQIIGSKEIANYGDQLDDVIDLNKVIIGPVVYSGSPVEILLALFSVESKDYANIFLNLLGSLSDMVGGGSELKLALQVINPLKEGVEGLIGLGKIEPKIGLHDTIGFNKGSFYGVVIDTKQNSDLENKLWVKGGRLFYRDPGFEKPIIYDKNDYFLFRFEWLDEREDWKSLTSIMSAYNIALEKTGSKEEESTFNDFKKEVIKSVDLTLPDKGRIIQYLRDAQEIIKKMSEPVRADKKLKIATSYSLPAVIEREELIRDFMVPFSDNKFNIKKLPREKAEMLTLADLEGNSGI